MRYGSVCSGIEAASVAWHPLGWRPAWFAEIEQFPSAVLAHRFPDVENLGDMTRLARRVLAGQVEAPEVLVGGTPCQAFSVAGMRSGLDDPRGQLTIKFVELADAIDHVRAAAGNPEAVIVWENVPGVLSDKGNAFGCFIGALVGESDALLPAGGRWTDAGCVYGPGRSAAWRVLDAQYFGLAQRRRRVFVVASARAGLDPAAVLFERDGVRRDSPPSRETGKGVANAVTTRTGSDDRGERGYLICMAHGQAGAGISENRAPTLTCNHEAPIVVHGTQDPDICIDHTHTLGRNSGQENAVLSLGFDTCATLDARTEGGGFPGTDGACGGHVIPVRAFAENSRAEGQPIVPVAYDFLGTPASEVAKPTDVHTPLRARAPGQFENSTVTVIRQPGSAVRRLTPRECERLQGFPDDWTLIPWRGKPAEDCPDGPRYKAIGNSKAVPVVRWIGRRIEAALRGQT